jgi:ribosomal protein RSM22 (predicted rRNA methylase)
LAERQPSKLHVASSNLVSRSTTPFAGRRASADAPRAERRAAIAARSLLLRRALARTITPGSGLTATASTLSIAYRSGTTPVDREGHIRDAATAEAYAAARMPATFAAIARAMDAAADRLPGFRPTNLLDIGAGTGAASWAASAVWPSLTELTLIDRAAAAIDLGRRLATSAPRPVAGARWVVADLEHDIGRRADLVTGAYVLGELPATQAADVVARLWAATDRVLVLVEPGSRPGFERIRAARAALIEAGGRVAAPCPNDEPCPIVDPAWCHFLARLDRSPLQRRTKAASRSWEDEPFSYVAVARPAAVDAEPAARIVLGRPRQRPGVVELRICRAGRIEQRTLSRRDGPAWKAARELTWGDPVPPIVTDRPAGAAGDEPE